MRVKCESCGKKYAAGEDLCPHCGAFSPMSRNSGGNAASAPPKRRPPLVKSPKRKFGYLAGILVSVLISIVITAELPALRTVDLSDNYITDIEALGDAPSLAYANLSGNPVRDWSPAEKWTSVCLSRR